MARIRDYRPCDAPSLNRLAQKAFGEYQGNITDWETVHAEWGRMSELAEHGQILVATADKTIVGGVCYLPPGVEKQMCFEQAWAVIRFLVVDPAHRKGGIGTRLTQMCIDRATQDQSKTIAALTSPIMAQAVNLYTRMGFTVFKDIGEIKGVNCLIYRKEL